MLFIIRLCSPSEHGHLFQATCQRPTFPWLYIWAFPQASVPYPCLREAPGTLANQEAPDCSARIALQRSLRQQARGTLGHGLVEQLFLSQVVPPHPALKH